MAKKILKRSLALGALMAFVITGSAMADGSVLDLERGGNKELNHGSSVREYNGIFLTDSTSMTINDDVEYHLKVSKVADNDDKQVFAFHSKTGSAQLTYNNNVSFYAETDMIGGGNSQCTAWWNESGGGIFTFNGNAKFNVVTTNENGKAAYGIEPGGNSTLIFNGSLVDININTATTRNDQKIRTESIGIDTFSENAKVIGSENTTFDIDVVGSATGEYVSPVYGIVSEPGFINIKGTADIYVESNGDCVHTLSRDDGTILNQDYFGYAVGIKAIDGYTNSSALEEGKANIIINNAKVTAINNAENGKAIGLLSNDFDHHEKFDAVITTNGNLDVKVKAAEASGVEALVGTGIKIGTKDSVIRIVTESSKSKANSLVAKYDGRIILTGKEVTLIGDVIAENGNINASGASLDLEGKVLTSGTGITNIDFGKGTWRLTGASSVTNATFGAGSVLKVNGPDFTENYAITGGVTVKDGAKLEVDGVVANTYKIVNADGSTLDGAWAKENIILDNALMAADWDAAALKDDKLDLVVTPKTASQIVDSTGVSSGAGSMLGSAVGMASAGNVPDTSKPAVDFIVNAMAGQASGNTPEGAGTAINSALQIGEAGGNSGTALSVVNNVASVTTQRLSFSQMNTAPQGGHGKVERKYKSGAGVWAQYMHGKDKVEDMPMDSLKSSYESQYNGAVIGYDFKEVGKTQTGIAFNYGEGDSHSTGGSIATRSDFDFWGVGLYHNIMNDDTNLILDINYSKSDSDVTQINGGTALTANPETTTLSAGVKVEKLIQNGPVQIVPYAGLRYMTVDTDDYAANIAGKKAFMYAPDRQNIWLIPVGVSLRQENTYENGWRVTPKADLSYIWAVGDTDSSMTVSIPGITNVANMNYTVMDNGSFLGTLGIEAEKGDWTYGLSYSYQKGEYQRSDKWFVDVRYSF